jgi:CDP-diacylglycerol--serine O-phosphatidyltransferase
MGLPPRKLVFIPNAVTAANIAVGFLAMLAAADGRFDLSVYLLFVCVMLDMADGRLARALKVTSKFGQEMDSLSDTVSFCVAPAFLVQRAVLQPLEGVGVAVAMLYILAGVYRLARFNLTSDEHTKARKTLGAPTPIAAGYIMALVLMRDLVPVPAAVALVLIMAMLMVSRIQLPELHGKSIVTRMMWVGLVNYIVLLVWPTWYSVIWWNVWNILVLVAAHREDRRLELSEST